jgi:hypothetical protein
MVEQLHKTDSVPVYRREFQQKFPGVDIPTSSTIHHLVNKIKTTGSVLDKKIKRRRHVLTAEKLYDICARCRVCQENPWQN